MEEGRTDVISLGVVVNLWTGSRAMTRYLETITIAYDISNPRPMWHRRLLAVVLTVAGLVAAIALLPGLVLGPRIVGWIAPPSVADAVIKTAGVFFCRHCRARARCPGHLVPRRCALAHAVAP